MVDYSFITNIFTGTDILGVTWIIPTVVAMLTVILITRDSQEIKTMIFPVMFGYHSIGLTQNFIFMLLSGIVYVQEGLSLNIVGTALTAVSSIGTMAHRMRVQAQEHVTSKEKAVQSRVSRYTQRQELADKVLLGNKARNVKSLELDRKALLEREWVKNKELEGGEKAYIDLFPQHQPITDAQFERILKSAKPRRKEPVFTNVPVTMSGRPYGEERKLREAFTMRMNQLNRALNINLQKGDSSRVNRIQVEIDAAKATFDDMIQKIKLDKKFPG